MDDLGGAHTAPESEVLEQGMPGVGVTADAAAPLPAAHMAVALEAALGACSEAKPPFGVMQKVEGQNSYNSQSAQRLAHF